MDTEVHDTKTINLAGGDYSTLQIFYVSEFQHTEL